MQQGSELFTMVFDGAISDEETRLTLDFYLIW